MKYTPQQLRKMATFLLMGFVFFMSALYVLLKWVF